MVNFLAPNLLTEALLPLLKSSNDGRVVNLSPAAQAPVSLSALQGKEALSDNAAYAQSKLALTMWSFRLAELEPELTVIAVNPGSLLNTKMANQAYGQHWSSADKGANILRNLALDDDFKQHSGEYFDNDLGNEQGTFAPAHDDAYKAARIDALLQTAQHMLTK